ncbi:MAG TPA: response regulator transcription factor [Gemmatimonadales bacterium]|nr:response regulator transcription factor [Gemmatimonadales bacterium]
MVRPTDAPVRARTLLVIDDEPPIRRAVANALRDVADRVVEAATGAQGTELAAAERPELVVLDLGLPDQPGVEVCREIRRWSPTPILVLTARHDESEKVLLFNSGADDYVTKPFSINELTARVRAHLRRAQGPIPSGGGTHTIGDLVIDLGGRTVRRNGEAIRLTPTEWDIFKTFLQHAGRTLTHQQLYDAVWRRPFGNPQQYLRVYITTLRRKIERNPARPMLIVTEPGVGYRLEP